MNNTTIAIINGDEILLDISQLHEQLAQIPDKRKARGKRYTLPILLLVIILAKLSGEDKPSGISDWAKLRKKELQAFFGYHREVKPGGNTIRRTMASSLAEEALQTYTRRYLHQIYGGQQSILMVLDGKCQQEKQQGSICCQPTCLKRGLSCSTLMWRTKTTR